METSLYTYYTIFLRICCGIPFISLTIALHAQGNLLDRPLELSKQAGTVSDFLELLSEESGVVLSYRSDIIQENKYIQLTGHERTVGQYLETIFANQNIKIKQKKGKILLIPLRKPPSKSFTISGYIRDLVSSEPLIYASIFIPKLNVGTFSNAYGFFSLTLPEDQYEIVVSYIGYQSFALDTRLSKDLIYTLRLKPEFELEEVEIIAEEGQSDMMQISAQKIHPEKLEGLPMLLGQADVLKQVQLLPGVQTMNEGVNGLVVRGGNSDQNLMLLDEVPIYNPSHSLGLFSVFYGSAIQKSSVLKGAFPAEVGGRLSSVVDVRMKEGSKDGFHGEISTGVLTGTFRLEGPIRKKKGKTSFHLSARRTLIDLLTNSIQLRLQETQQFPFFITYHFQDFNFKIHHQASRNTHFSFSTYFGNDLFRNEQFKIDNEGNSTGILQANTFLNWGNRTAAFRWNQVIGAKWFLNTTIHTSNYAYTFANFESDPLAATSSDTINLAQTGYYSQSQIRDIGIKISADYYPTLQHQFKIGVGYVDHQYSPFISFATDTLIAFNDSLFSLLRPSLAENKTFAEEMFVFVQDHWKINPTIQLRYGFRTALFRVDLGSYLRVQPRVAGSWQVADRHRLGLAYSHMVQFSHLLTSPGIGLPSDLWVPSTSQIKPQEAHHFNLSYTWRGIKGYQIQVEAFYKRLLRILDYQQSVSFQSTDPNEEWEKLVTVGKGWSYGLETFVQKTLGKTTGWLSYSLSWSKRQFDGINDGKPFPFRYDRRHDLSLTITHKPKFKREWGLVWMIATGQAVTLGQQRFESLFSPIPIIPEGPRNGYRAPSYHRLDLSLSLHKQKKRGIRTWIIGFYNAYNQQNPFILRFRDDFMGNLQLYQTSLLPILPYISYRFRF